MQTEATTETTTELTTAELISPIAEEFWISDVFGKRTNPITKKTENHKGIDLAVEINTPVLACADGVVTECTTSDSFGHYLKIKGEKYLYVYGHLSGFNVQKGDEVKQGQTVAFSGNTGQSTGPHLHFELYQGEKNINPSFIFEQEFK